MEFVRSEPRESISRHPLHSKYPTDLNMYLDIPTEQIEIEEFQELAVERVKLLRIFEATNVKASKDVPFKELVIDEMLKQNVKYFLPLVKGYPDYEARRRDHLSHFILRLSYCRSEEYRRWFLARELEFFRLKFSNMERKDEILLFLKKNQLNYNPISDEEKRSLASDLINSTMRNITLEVTNIYKVPFQQVLDLVKSRKVFVKSGFAYVPHHDFISILTSIFRTKLSHALTICAMNLVDLESDERLSRILRGLHTSYTGNDFSVKNVKDHVPISALDALSQKSFPLCMRSMYETFKKTHHLRYQGRLQFGLFLKGIGVTLEDSLKFWKDGFTQKAEIDADKFEKNYAYNIRHSYGKEGKRANYTPHSCLKIINTNVGPGDTHGCPFRHNDINHLRQKLQSYNLSVTDIGDVIDYVSRGHYQLACTRYFEITHNIQNAKGINHPNLYFEESQNVINEKANDNKKPEPQRPRKSIVNDEWGNDSAFDVDMTAVLESAENGVNAVE